MHGGSSPAAYGIRSASPCGPAQTSSGSATWAGTRPRRSTGSRSGNDSVLENFGWPCYEGVRRHAGLPERRTSASATACMRPPARSLRPISSYLHGASTSSPVRVARPARARSTRAGVLPGRAVSGVLRRCAVLRRPLPELHLGGAGPAPTGSPISRRSRPLMRTRTTRWSSRSVPAGISTTSNFDGGSIKRIQYFGVEPASARCGDRLAHRGCSSARGAVRREPARAIRTPATPSRYSWDLERGRRLRRLDRWPRPASPTPWAPTSSGCKVTDSLGLSTTSDPITISAGNTAPVPAITSPDSAHTWAVGDTISFEGGAADAQDSQVAASGLSWALIMHHCPSDCHTHLIQTWTGVSSGSFVARTTTTPRISSSG